MSKNPPLNIGLLFDWHADRKRTTTLHLDRPFDLAADDATTYTAQQLADLVRELAASLHAAGVRRGDRVAVVKPNHFDVLIASAAAARIGAVAATISAANRPAHLEEMLHNLQPALTLTTSTVLDQASALEIDLTRFAKTVLIDDGVPGRHQTVALADLRGAPEAPLDLRGDNEPMMITHSSGTTDCPKLVVHTAKTNGATARLELLRIPLIISRKDDICLSSISFAHSRAYAWAAAQFKWGPKALLIASTHDPGDLERLIEDRRPTTVEATPNVFQHWLPLAARRPELFADVRYYMNTFDMMHPSIARPFMNASTRRMPMWGHSWGQSEVGPIAGAGYSRRGLNKTAGTAHDNMNNFGWPWRGLINARVVDPDTGQRRRTGHSGVIVVRSKSICVDYLGETDRHEAKLDNGWWNTGDVGYKDRLGRIHFLDRAVDCFPGGSATEVESVLLQRLESAAEVVVLTRGDLAPVPVIAFADPAQLLDPDAWDAAIADLPALAEPIVVGWHDLPRTSTWKVRRKELRERVLADDQTELEERFT